MVKGLKLKISAVGVIYLTSFDIMKIVSLLSFLSPSNSIVEMFSVLQSSFVRYGFQRSGLVPKAGFMSL